MPRRNKRVEVDTSLPGIERYSTTYQKAQRDAEREFAQRRRTLEVEKREAAKVRSVPHCVWPECTERLMGVGVGIPPVPLCFKHVDTVHRTLTLESDELTRIRESGFRRDRLANETADTRMRKRDRELRGLEPGYIYYLRIGEHIKLGFTSDIRRRLTEYPPNAEVLAVHAGNRDLEAELHKRFRAAREHGREWYRPTDQLQAHIAAMVAKHGEPSRFQPGYQETSQVTHLRARSRRAI